MNACTTGQRAERLRSKVIAISAATSVFALSVLLAPISFAQDEEDVFELSPFTVDGNDVSGYMTRSTTSGTRLRTDLKDLGAQIDVFSQEFLDDIGASDPEEAFLYSLNIENEMENPDYGDGNRARFERSGPAATARGLGNSRTTGTTSARNFFSTELRTHGYNIESLSISSGPNSILFGLGQAGATVNSVLKRATASENFGGVGLKFDNHGTKMFTLDYNKVLIKDKLSVRIGILENKEDSFMQGNYDNQTRFYGTVSFVPNDKMSFRVHYEDIDEVESPTQYRMFQDNISPWMVDGGGVLYDPADGARPPTMNGDSGRETLLVSADGSIDVDTVGITKWNSQYGARSDELSDYVEYVSENGITDSIFYDVNYLDTLDDRSVTFSPETLELYGLPYKSVNPWGDTMRRTRKAEIFTAFAEFNPLKDLFIEVGFNDEKMDARQFGYNRSFNYGVFVDTAKYLPDGSPNPKAGQLFMQDEGWAWESPTTEKEFRVTASYEYNFREKEWIGDKMADFLGRHRLALLGSKRDASEIRSNSFQIWKQNDDGSTPSFLQGGATNVTDPNASWMNNGDRRVSTRQYLLPENNYQLQVIENWAPGAELVTLPDQNGTGNLQAAFFDPEVGTNRLFSYDREIKSKMLAYQGYFWKDRVILTYGKREDDVRERDLAGAGDRAQNYSEDEWNSGQVPAHVIPGGYFPWYTELGWNAYGESGTNKNETKGIVFRPVGVADWLSVFYNEGSNNSAGAVRYDAYGGRNDPITGEGKDYGVRFDLFDNKLTFKINMYETASANVETGGGSVDGDVRGVFRELEERLYDTNPSTYTANGFDIFGQTDLYLPVADKSSEGTEYTLMAQPKKGWNVRLTAAKTKAVLDNIATSYINWGVDRTPTWQGLSWLEEDLDSEYKPVVAWWPNSDAGVEPTRDELIAGGFTRMDPATNALLLDDNGDIAVFRTRLGAPGVDTPISGWENVGMSDGSNNETVKEYYDRRFLVNTKGRIEQLNGVSNPNVRKWRVNLSTSYEFQDGRFQGWRVGGSMRFRDKGVVGFGRKTVGDGADQITVLDINEPYYNDAEYYFDGMLAYRGTFGEDKLRYRVQLNVRNMFDNDNLYATDVSTTGRPLVYAGVEPRTWVLSADLDF